MSSFSLHGVTVSSGVAIGKAHLISNALLEVAHYQLPKSALSSEISRFSKAITTVKRDLETVRKELPDTLIADVASFINTQIAILLDPSLSEAPKRIMRKELCNAEWAIKLQMDIIVEQFDAITDAYLRERKQDVIQVVERVIKALLGHPSAKPVKQTKNIDNRGIILVAHDISPADAIQYKQNQFSGFITDVGGATSHTAILARGLNIPSIIALQKAHDLIKEDEIIIVDGSQGVVVVNPSKEILREYELKQHQWLLEQQKLSLIKSTKTKTIDGTAIDLLANIESIEGLNSISASGATGIGLFRTEFLFMNRDEPPSEEEQYQAYKKVVQIMKKKPVTIRTLDLGADKQAQFSNTVLSNNALGLRALRLCLTEPHIFHTQLRALLRASHYGNLKILIPMITTLAELRQTKIILERAKESLEEDQIPFDKKISLGGMIEVPAAAINAAAFARELDFLSIGTNDLTQYTLAVDRTDNTVAHLYNSLHPAVLRLILMTIEAGKKFKKPVAVCGEIAGDSMLTKLLLGMGLRQFSMHPSQVLSVKQQILQSDINKLTKAANRILKIDDVEKVELQLKKLTHIPT
ncbi:MAG: phosphoenolpyruvate--protein phosphotransferase [Methylophilaceae bacterium]